ncbi:MAG: redoxin family protein [Caldilineaceae bacterium]|nr:redoxin family protein [Caldilineaceae bacterium]
MAPPRFRRRLWIIAGFPLLAVLLTALLLVAVRTSDGSAAALTPSPFSDNALVSTPQVAEQALPARKLPQDNPSTPRVATPMRVEADAAQSVLTKLESTESTENVVALVGTAFITQQDLQEAVRIDGLMAGLAGASPTAAESLVEQLINTEVILQRAGDAETSIDAAAVLAAFLQSHGKAHEELAAALQASGISQERFERYFARLVAADAYQRAQQKATGIAPAELMRQWQQTIPINFDPTAAALPAADVNSPSNTKSITITPESDGVEIAAAATSLPASTELRGVEAGQLAPEFELPTITDEASQFTLRTLQDEPSVLSFWTTWCPYCLRQTPVLVDAYRHGAAEGIEFVGINVQEDRSAVAAYVARHGITYPVLLDEQGSVAADYAVQGYPTTYFLDKEHRIVARHVGALTDDQLDTYLAMLQSPEQAR